MAQAGNVVVVDLVAQCSVGDLILEGSDQVQIGVRFTSACIVVCEAKIRVLVRKYVQGAATSQMSLRQRLTQTINERAK